MCLFVHPVVCPPLVLLVFVLLLFIRWLQTGVMPQAEAFRAGCAEVFPVSKALSYCTSQHRGSAGSGRD